MSNQVAASMPLQAVEKKTRVRWNIFLAILFLMAVNYIDRASLSVAMPIIAKEFELTPTMLDGFEPGTAMLRATAVGRSQWLRIPPPTVREQPVRIAAR